MFYTFCIYCFCLFGCTSGSNFIDVNDILNVDYMPGSLLLLEGSDSIDDEIFGRNVSKSKIESSDPASSGSIMDAYSTMGFHRKMMNEYLCRNFVADQILTDMSLTRIKRRMGTATLISPKLSKDVEPIGNRRKDLSVKDNLLSDEGSANYKHWLTKSTTLEDIYRHYENQAQDRGIDNHGGDDEDDDEDEYEGEVTGYALGGQQLPQVPHSHRGTPSKIGYGHSGGGGGGGYGNSGYGAGGGHPSYGEPEYGGHDFTPQHIHYHQEEYEEHGKGEKELALSDLFEIALTAIAFLSFGCYILQVIMCITNSTTTTTAVTMMPMMMDPGGNGDDGDDDDDDGGDNGDAEPVRIRYRRRRSTENTINERLNELSKRVLLSIESALIADEDKGNCLRQQLCENNKYSRTLKDNQKIWVPVWSFGMSYLTGRFISQVPPATVMLDSLKASILGLGNANCKVIFSNCNLSKMREDRRRRRRKRSTEEKSK